MQAAKAIVVLFEKGATSPHQNEPIFRILISKSVTAYVEECTVKLEETYSASFSPAAKNSITTSLINDFGELLGPFFEAHYKAYRTLAMRNEKISTEPVSENTVRSHYIISMSHGGGIIVLKRKKYLVQQIDNLIHSWELNLSVLTKRLRHDYSSLIARATSAEEKTDDPTELIEIANMRLGLSDRHHGHQSVCLVELKKTTLVYKPRPLEAERSFYELLSELADLGLGQSLHIPWVMPNKAYGWMEYCEPIGELDTVSLSYFSDVMYNYGIMAVVWYMLGGSDLHHENIFLSKRGPVIVDCETVFEMDYYYGGHTFKKLNPAFEPDFLPHTLISTAAYSVLLDTENGLVNTGGLRHIRDYFLNDKSTKNAHHKTADWSHLVDRLCEGTNDALAFFLSNSQTSLFELMTKHFKDATALRILPRDTAIYGQVVRSCMRMYSLQDSSKKIREFIHSTLENEGFSYSGRACQNYIRAYEVLALKDRDIPYIRRSLHRNKLYLGSSKTGHQHENVAFCSLKNRLQIVRQPGFLTDQLWLIGNLLDPQSTKMHLQALNPGLQHTNLRAFSYKFIDPYSIPINDRGSMEQALETIANQVRRSFDNEPSIAMQAVFMAHDSQFKDFELVAQSDGIHRGRLGALLFLGAYYNLTKDSKTRQTIMRTMDYYLDTSRIKSVLAVNTHSVQQTLQTLYYVASFLKINGIITNNLDFLKSSIGVLYDSHERSRDLITSTPGFIAFSRAFSYTAEAKTAAYATELKELLRSTIDQWEDLDKISRVGLAHGILGPCLIAGKIAPTIKDQSLRYELRELTVKALELEKSAIQTDDFLQKTLGTWGGWCYGTAGRALTYQAVGEGFLERSITSEAQGMVSIEKMPYFITSRLCCGTLGYIAAHLSINHELSEQQRIDNFCRMYNDARHEFVKRDCPDDLSCSSLFYGIEGLGLVLTYCLEPTTTPKVWEFS